MSINVIKSQKNDRKVAAEAILNAAIAAGRGMNKTEQEQYDNHVAEIRSLENVINQHAELATFGVEKENPVVVAPKAGTVVDPRASKEYSADFFSMIRTGNVQGALSVGTPAAGGYATPTEFDKSIVERLQNENIFRQLASVITTEGDRNLTIENNLGAAGWTAEAAVATNDNGADDNSFSRVTLSSYKLTRIIKVSEELLTDAFFDLPGYLAQKFAAAFGIAEETACVAGNGTGKPTGVLSGASDSGVVTAAPTAITFDEVLGVYHSLKRAYRDRASWLLNDSTALLLRKVKDTTGQYIWNSNVQVGQPISLLGKPVYFSDAMPAAAATNKSILFGDFSYYTIADRGARTFLRLNELYMGNGQVGFRAVGRLDGKLTLGEAVVFLTQHA
jgi:HK97 family phage major capsid protein